MLKTVKRHSREWLWPEYDTELIKVFDTVDDLDEALPYCVERRVAVQAGGACGVWPYVLGECFDAVYTFEPDDTNFMCLVRNAPGVYAYRAALGRFRGCVDLAYNAHESTNAGAQFVVAGGAIPTLRIDDLGLPICDLIQLDVEGSEADALYGGIDTIREYRPVVMVEAKPLPQGDTAKEVRDLLAREGYLWRKLIHNDEIWVHDSATRGR